MTDKLSVGDGAFATHLRYRIDRAPGQALSARPRSGAR
jgi:hypothetical protein